MSVYRALPIVVVLGVVSTWTPQARGSGKTELEVECRQLRIPSTGAIPLELAARCASSAKPATGEAAPESSAAVLMSRGPILAAEASANPDTIDSTSIPGIATLTSFGAVVASDFIADVELDTTASPVAVWVLTGSGIASRMNAAGFTTPLPNNPPPPGRNWTDLARDPTSGILYASAVTCGTASSLSTIDLSAGSSVSIGTITNSACMIAIAFDNAGNLYGVDIGSDSLVAIDKTTGAGTVVGPLGFDANFGQAMDCDPVSATCYVFAFNATAFQDQLRSVDLATGATTLLGAIGSTAPGGTVQTPGAVFGTIVRCNQDADCNPCFGEICVGQECQPGTPVDCTDGLFCTIDRCDPANGACAHDPNSCSDGNGCTDDTCDEAGDLCMHVNACTELCDNASIGINDGATPPTLATPYPASISVSGLGVLTALEAVRLRGINHTFPDDIDILLAGPAGQNAILMSDVGGAVAAGNVDLVLSDSAGASLPDAGPLVSGTFRPTNVDPGVGTEAWPAPAPLPTGGSALNAFAGTNPNGAWRLYVVDDQSADLGSISAGWCLDLRTGCAPPAEVNGTLRVAKTSATDSSIGWADAPGPFNVYRGVRFAGAAWEYDQSCLDASTFGPTLDADLPQVGDVFYYLVSRRGPCGESIVGRNGQGAPEPNPHPCGSELCSEKTPKPAQAEASAESVFECVNGYPCPEDGMQEALRRVYAAEDQKANALCNPLKDCENPLPTCKAWLPGGETSRAVVTFTCAPREPRGSLCTAKYTENGYGCACGFASTTSAFSCADKRNEVEKIHKEPVDGPCPGTETDREHCPPAVEQAAATAVHNEAKIEGDIDCLIYQCTTGQCVSADPNPRRGVRYHCEFSEPDGGNVCTADYIDEYACHCP